MWYQMKGNIMISFTKYTVLKSLMLIAYLSVQCLNASISNAIVQIYLYYKQRSVRKRDLFQLVQPNRMHTICLFIPNTIYKNLTSHLQRKCCPSPLMLCPAEGMKLAICLEGAPQPIVLEVIHSKPIIV